MKKNTKIKRREENVQIERRTDECMFTYFDQIEGVVASLASLEEHLVTVSSS